MVCSRCLVTKAGWYCAVSDCGMNRYGQSQNFPNILGAGTCLPNREAPGRAVAVSRWSNRQAIDVILDAKCHNSLSVDLM